MHVQKYELKNVNNGYIKYSKKISYLNIVKMLKLFY